MEIMGKRIIGFGNFSLNGRNTAMQLVCKFGDCFAVYVGYSVSVGSFGTPRSVRLLAMRTVFRSNLLPDYHS
jgi:hypothetical protein